MRARYDLCSLGSRTSCSDAKGHVGHRKAIGRKGRGCDNRKGEIAGYLPSPENSLARCLAGKRSAFRNQVSGSFSYGRDNAECVRDPRQSENALQASISLARGRPLQSAFDPILRAIGISMDSPVVALRSKALRALGSIVTVDPDVLALVSTQLLVSIRLRKLISSPLSRRH